MITTYKVLKPFRYKVNGFLQWIKPDSNKPAIPLHALKQLELQGNVLIEYAEEGKK